jgi:hypothetical protein
MTECLPIPRRFRRREEPQPRGLWPRRPGRPAKIIPRGRQDETGLHRRARPARVVRRRRRGQGGGTLMDLVIDTYLRHTPGREREEAFPPLLVDILA